MNILGRPSYVDLPAEEEHKAEPVAQATPAPQQQFAGFPEYSDRPLGKVPVVSGLDVHRTPQPAPEFKFATPEQPEGVLPKVPSVQQQTEPRAEQSRPSEDPVDHLLKDQQNLQDFFAGTPRPGVLQQTAEATPQRRSEQVERKLEASNLSERQKNEIRALQLSDQEIADLLDKITDTKQTVRATKQAVLGKVRR